MASRGRRGGAPACEDEPRHEERAEQQAPTPQGPVLPPPLPMDYGVFMQGLVQAMQTQAHTQTALHAQLEAQEGEMEQYLEEKKASQKRPATTFQRQDKKKVVYQTQQRSVAVGSTQIYSKGIKRLGEALLGLSQEVPNQPPRWPSSGVLRKFQSNPRSGMPSSMIQQAP
ncbi:hypothetical protein Taro_042385 [Colocasia esculenta]|uniref:Uncharacterized protein n=1 Tax=Colocasia esculenta TaxID=4460 RepID=A0A843WWC0_COLES|nr:hypothetical protein [Colocasia esculenta]